MKTYLIFKKGGIIVYRTNGKEADWDTAVSLSHLQNVINDIITRKVPKNEVYTTIEKYLGMSKPHEYIGAVEIVSKNNFKDIRSEFPELFI